MSRSKSRSKAASKRSRSRSKKSRSRSRSRRTITKEEAMKLKKFYLNNVTFYEEESIIIDVLGRRNAKNGLTFNQLFDNMLKYWNVFPYIDIDDDEYDKNIEGDWERVAGQQFKEMFEDMELRQTIKDGFVKKVRGKYFITPKGEEYNRHQKIFMKYNI